MMVSDFAKLRTRRWAVTGRVVMVTAVPFWSMLLGWFAALSAARTGCAPPSISTKLKHTSPTTQPSLLSSSWQRDPQKLQRVWFCSRTFVAKFP